MIQSTQDTPEQYGTDGKALVARWLDEIKLAEKGMRAWFDQGDKILKRYVDERPENNSLHDRKFNVLWSNIETLKPALYNRTPEPKVLRKYRDRDPLARKAAETLERAVKYDLADGAFDEVMRRARDDFLLFGRGVAWVRYKPVFENLATGGEEESGTGERVIAEDVAFDYVGRKEFLHPMVPSWDKVPWVARISFMTKTQARARFDPEIVAKLPVKHKREGASDGDLQKNTELFGRIKIYEIWDKVEGRVLWLCPDHGDGPLDVVQDPLGLMDFFPCPKPLYATLTNESLVPIPDYHEYASQAKELDDLSVRIAHLTRAVKVNGAYNGALPELSRLLSEDNENEMIPVNEWPAFQQTGGLDGHMSFLPIQNIIQVLISLQQQRERVKADLYEITGLSDIMRGYSAPSATATAEQLKSNFASMRLEERQSRMAEFARGLLRIKAEIIAEHFSPETIRDISNYEESPNVAGIPVEEVVALLRNDKMRAFRLSVETDATVAPDLRSEKQARMEFLSAVGGFIDNAFMAGQQTPEAAPLLFELLKFGVRGFPIGRQLEEMFDQVTEQLSAAPEPMPEMPPQPDWELQLKQQDQALKAQGLQLKNMELMLKQAFAEKKLQAETGVKLAELAQTETAAARDDATTARGQDLDAFVDLRAQDIKAVLAAGGVAVDDSMDWDSITREIIVRVGSNT